MPEVAFDREFLHRCCVQFSIPLEKADVQVECNHALNFVRQHGHEHPLELSRALIWRVTDAEDPLDRSGAWRLLNAVILCCSDTNDDLFKTKVLSKIHPFMHYLIAYRWFTLKHRRDKNSGQEGKKESSSPNAFSVDLSKTGAIISAEAFRGVPPEISALTRDQVVSLQNIYGSILSSWKTVFSAYVYYELKERVRSIERNGNDLSASAEKYLEIPNTFKDSLWRLRRQEPNPAAAWHVLRSYGWYRTGEKAVDGEAEELRVRPASLTVPSSVDEVSALDPSMHPTVLKWAMKVIAFKGGCRMCNTWKHCEWACPCERPFVRFHADESNENQVRMFRPKRVQPPRYHKLDAVDVLYKYDIKLPLRVDSVLDAIVKLIQSERSYDDVVDAFDAVRGAVTGPLERHALWLHASHQLKPSATLFQKPSDEDLSPAMQKAKEHLYKLRRYRDWKELLGAVEVLDGPFRRHSLPPQTNECIKEIRETSSFAFCLIDGTLPPSYTPAKYARVPEEVMRIAPIKDILCRSCLEPFHSMSACPHRDGDLPIEDWDMRIAKETLMEYDLVTIEWPEQMYRIDAVLEQIDADDRMAKDFRKAELNLAVKIIFGRRTPVCPDCGKAGHMLRNCLAKARRVFATEGFAEVDAKLYPTRIERRVSELFRELRTDDAVALRTAASYYTRSGRNAYPPSYGEAVEQLRDSGIPLAAARYTTLEVQNFLHSIGLSDLLVHLGPLKAVDFPEVCFYCDKLDHHTEDCSEALEEEQGFLRDLRSFEVDLWAYLHRRSYYEERLPTRYIKGRDSILEAVERFKEDYSPGGVAQKKFIEQNHLGSLLRYGQSGTALYGSGFSQMEGAEKGSEHYDVDGGVTADSRKRGRADSPSQKPHEENNTVELTELTDLMA